MVVAKLTAFTMNEVHPAAIAYSASRLFYLDPVLIDHPVPYATRGALGLVSYRCVVLWLHRQCFSGKAGLTAYAVDTST